jgi:hypothetical protein
MRLKLVITRAVNKVVNFVGNVHDLADAISYESSIRAVSIVITILS